MRAVERNGDLANFIIVTARTRGRTVLAFDTVFSSEKFMECQVCISTDERHRDVRRKASSETYRVRYVNVESAKKPMARVATN